MAQDDVIYEELFYKFQEQPTIENYLDVIRALCDMKQLWFALRVNLGDDPLMEKMQNQTKPAAIILKEDAGMRADVLIAEDGTRMYPIFTDAANAYAHFSYYENTGGVLAIGTTKMEKVLKIMENNAVNATQIIVNLMCKTQTVLNEEAVDIAAQIVAQNKERDEANDQQYIEGRKLSDDAMQTYFGTGVKKDKALSLKLYAKAAELLQAAAERGNTKAQYDLGLLIRNGHGVEQDFEKAAYWLRQSVLDCGEDKKKSIEEIIAQFEFYKGRK